MTTAASVGLGRFLSSPGTSTSISTISAAPTTPVSCVLAPACSATAVRDPLVLTGKPLEEPGGDIGDTDPDHLAIPIDLLPGARGECRGGGDRVGQRDECDPERARDEQREV